MSDKIFLVFREGVYRHELCGVDSDEAEAVKCAQAFAAADVDDHYAYVVYETAVGRRAEPSGGDSFFSPRLDDAMDVRYGVSRSDARKGQPEARYMNPAELDRLDALRQDAEARGG